MSAPRETKELANLVWEVVGRRYRFASTYYTLYWLSEVKGYTPAEFDYTQLVDDLARGLYWYGVYATTREALHFGSVVDVVGPGTSAGNVRQTFDMGGGEDRVFAALENEIGPHRRNREAINAALNLLSEDAQVVQSQLPRGGAGRTPLIKFFDTADTAFPMLSDTETWLEGISELFGEIPQGPPQRRGQRGLVWDNQYGGGMWARATNHILRRAEISDPAWIDQTFAIEHNAGNWLDKVLLQAEQIAQLKEVASYRGGFPEDRVMQNILDAARNEEMDKLFSVAVLFEDELDVDLTRAAREFDVSTDRMILFAPRR